MIIFSPPRLLVANTIEIPLYLRAALGYHSSSRLWVSTQPLRNLTLGNEVLVSPISLSRRSDLWLLRGSFQDRPGILATLTAHLREANIDIVSLRSQTSDQNESLQVYLLLDANFYAAQFDLDTNERGKNPTFALNELRAQVVALLIEDLHFSAAGKPVLSIRRNLPLLKSASRPEFRQLTELSDGTIVLPASMMEALQDRFYEAYPNIANLRGKRRLPLVCLTADLEASLLRLTVYYRNTGHIHARVSAANRVGALALLTQKLRERELNVLSMYTRNTGSGDIALTDFLLNLPSEIDEKKNDSSLQRYIRAIIRTREIRELSAEISFPPPDGD